MQLVLVTTDACLGVLADPDARCATWTNVEVHLVLIDKAFCELHEFLLQIIIDIVIGMVIDA
jgi:hypothetical protein